MKKTTLRHVGQSMAEGSFNFGTADKKYSPIYNSRKLIYHYIYGEYYLPYYSFDDIFVLAFEHSSHKHILHQQHIAYSACCYRQQQIT